MKVHTTANQYVNPRKNRRQTASERRGQEMLKGCLYDTTGRVGTV